jgi:hypothetical protein
LDIVAQRPTGEIELVISASEDWESDDEALELLDRKIKVYLSYIRSQFRKEYGNAPVSITLSAAHEPTADVRALMAAVADATGIPMNIIVIPLGPD